VRSQYAQAGVAVQEPSPFYTKPTYIALSNAIDESVLRLDETNWQISNVGAVEKLKDQLFLSPRLEQWKQVKGGIGTEFRIYNVQQNTFVSVYRDKIVLEKAGDEYGIVSDPLLAETLFNNLESAQALVQRVPDETDPEAFFSGDESDFYEGAGLDAALEESHAEPMVEEDAELIEEVVADTEDPLGKIDRLLKDGTPGQIAVDDEVPYTIQTQLHDAKIKNHVGKINKSAASEAEDIKEEYKDRVPQKSKESRDELAKSALIGRSALSRLKSLQGRVLTIMDAAIADKAQRDAVKTLINKEFRRDITKINGDYSEPESDE
jgi:hypothetical protein